MPAAGAEAVARRPAGAVVPDGPMRAMFLREFSERLAPLVERALQAGIGRGALRDLDAKLVVLSVVSLAAGEPRPVFGVRNDEEFITRFVQHTQALPAHGTADSHSAGRSTAAGIVARARARQ